MSFNRKMLGVLGAAAGLALLVSGCAPAGTPSGDGAHTTLTASHPQEPASWNYLEDTTSALMVPTYLNVMESLFESDASGALQPLLATGYEVSDDGLVYTISLREATFQDGSELTADDVVYSLNKNKAATNVIVSAALSAVESVEATDDRTVVVTLSEPSNAFKAGLGSVPTLIAPEGFFETDDVGKKLIGTGPFSFGEYRPDIDLTLERYDGYWGEKPFMEKVIHRFMKDETASINALKSGELDIIGTLFGDGVEQVATFEGDDAYAVTFLPSTEISYLFLNPAVEAFQDERVRQAIAYAIDRDPIITAGVGGYGQPSCLYVFPWDVPWNSDYCAYPYDPEKSKELLAEAGYADGLTIDYPYLTIAEFPATFELVAAQLAEVGITVEGRGQDLATYFEQSWNTRDYQLSHMTGNGTFQALSCTAGAPPFDNLGNGDLCDPVFEGYVAANDKIVDADEYVAEMAALAKYVTDQAWIIPLFGKNVPVVAQDNVSGIAQFRTNSEMDYRHITWEE